MGYFKHLELREMVLIIVALYTLLWLLDQRQAHNVLREIITTGVHIKDSLTLIRLKIWKNTHPPFLRTFLSTPNPKLLQVRNGFYHQPVGYYIEIDSDTGSCRPRYSKEFRGPWKTPASILCPQIQKLLSQNQATTRIASGSR